MKFDKNESSAVNEFVRFLTEYVSDKNLFWWNNGSAQWEKIVLNSDYVQNMLMENESELYFWKNMPLLVPRPDFVEAAIESAALFGKTAQAFVADYIQSSQEVLNTFIDNINCASPVAASAPPVEDRIVEQKRQDPEWENRWLEWTQQYSEPPQQQQSNRLVSSEISATLPSILPEPLCQSALDERLAQLIASEQKSQAQSAPPLLSSDQYHLDQLRHSLSPLQQSHIDTLQGMGFETKVLLDATNFFLKKPDFNNFHELLDHIFEL